MVYKSTLYITTVLNQCWIF